MLRSISRLVVCGLLGLGLLAGPEPAGAQDNALSGTTVRVGTFGGSWRDAIHERVGKQLEEMGVTVEYVIGNPAENLSKIIAARGRAIPVDVMELGPAERIAMIRQELLEDIPAEQIENLSKLPSEVVEDKVAAHLIIQNGIVYRVDRFEEESIPVPESYGDLIHPELENRIAFPDVTNTQHWTAVAALAHEAGGSEEAPELGFEMVNDMKPQYFFSAASELAQKFALGDVIAAPWHAGWGVRLDRSGEDVGFVHPQVGDARGAVEYNYLGIVKGTENNEAAAAFINAFLDTQAQAEFARDVGAVPTNREARALLAEDENLSRFMMLDDAEIQNAFTVDWEKVDQEEWRAKWSRTVTR